MTAADRQKRRYDRRKAGLVRFEEWIPKGTEDAVQAAVDQAVKDAEAGKEDHGQG